MKREEQKLLGIIEVLGGGFGLVVRRPWVLLIPIALDLFVWLGPQINAKPLFDQISATMRAAAPVDAPAETLQTYETFQSGLQALGDGANVFGALSVGLIPTVFSIYPPTPSWTRQVWLVVPNEPSLVLVLLPLGCVGLFLASVYLETLARALRGDPAGVATFVPRVLRAYVTLLTFVFFAVMMLIGLVLAVAFGVALVSDLSSGLASSILFGGMLVMLWATVYLAFAIPSIFVSGARAAQAVFNSIRIFRHNFWHAIGFIFLAYIIQMGFAVIWQQLEETTWGIVFDVVANAFLGSGLIAAGMLFYHDRITWLQTLAAQSKPGAANQTQRR